MPEIGLEKFGKQFNLNAQMDTAFASRIGI